MTRAGEVVRVFLKLGAISYGGPAMLGIMQDEIQAKRAWLSRERFVEGLALVNMLPGPLAAQLSIFLGYVRLGLTGGVLAGICFIIPAFCIMLGLTLIHGLYGGLPAVRGAFYGISPVVLGIFSVAVYRLGTAAVKDAKQLAIALGCALLGGLTSFGIIPGLLLSAAAGVVLYGAKAARLMGALAGLALLTLVLSGPRWPTLPGLSRLALDTAAASPTPGVWELGRFFFQVGAFTFGGGLAILAFLQKEVVTRFHWLSPQEFLDGLALGQLTPGPIVMLAAFVGYRVAGLWGAAVSAVSIFLPSFVLVLSVAPLLDRVRHVGWVTAALKGIGPAVIGMIAVTLLQMMPHAMPDVVTGLIAVATVVTIMVWRVDPLPLMGAGGVLGIVLRAR